MHYVLNTWHVITFAIGAGLVGWIWWTSFRSSWIGLGAMGIALAWAALLVGTEWVLSENHNATLQALVVEAAHNGRFWIAAGIGSVGALCLLASLMEKLFGTPPRKPAEPGF